MRTFLAILIFSFLLPIYKTDGYEASSKHEEKINVLVSKMTLKEKIGQMCQRDGSGGYSEDLEKNIREGCIGSVLNAVGPDYVNKIQKIAVEETRLGIPLIIGRDVIHGFRTVFPIPLGQAASWNPELVQEAAKIAAIEAASQGVKWTFAPMLDIARDPRWGRIAESPGEDPYLACEIAKAMVKGFQGNTLSDPSTIAACGKHFVGYGAAEGGRDYNTTYIPKQRLLDVYLQPFKAAVDEGAVTIMTAFNEINGVPATGNKFILKQILRNEWQFDGFVVSDWNSINEMIVHGYAADAKDAALKSINAGVDMEMVSTTYRDHLEALVQKGAIPMETIDNAVKNILLVKYQLDLFENPYVDSTAFPPLLNENHLQTSKELAKQSIVLLKNDNHLLPLSKHNMNISVIGPLANAPHDQLGTWSYDGKAKDSRTPLNAIRNYLGEKTKIHFSPGLTFSRDQSNEQFDQAVSVAEQSDVILFFGGEESILSGEAHCRANLDLPGAQNELIDELKSTEKPLVLVVLAGRPLTIKDILDKVDAVLYAWHPGTMGGPALAEIIFGDESPSGKLPVTFPKSVGQIPIYYAHKNTGRPPTAETWTHIDDIPPGALQTSLGNTSHYLDEGYLPLFPFGFGLSYTKFKYENIRLSSNKIVMNDTLKLTAEIMNVGKTDADEIVQLYVRDLVANITRPVKELKGFKKVHLKAGEMKTITFALPTDHLSFHNQDMEEVTEPGEFFVWIGPNSHEGLKATFEVIDSRMDNK